MVDISLFLCRKYPRLCVRLHFSHFTGRYFSSYCLLQCRISFHVSFYKSMIVKKHTLLIVCMRYIVRSHQHQCLQSASVFWDFFSFLFLLTILIGRNPSLKANLRDGKWQSFYCNHWVPCDIFFYIQKLIFCYLANSFVSWFNNLFEYKGELVITSRKWPILPLLPLLLSFAWLLNPTAYYSYYAFDIILCWRPQWHTYIIERERSRK